MRWKSSYSRIVEGAVAVVFGVFAFEGILIASSLLLAYAATLTDPSQALQQGQAQSAPEGLLVSVLAAFVSGWTARGALRRNRPPRVEESTINSG